MEAPWMCLSKWSVAETCAVNQRPQAGAAVALSPPMAAMTCCTLRATTPPSLAGPGRVSVVIIQARKSPCCCPSRSLSLSRLYTASQSQAGRRHKAHQKPTQPHIIAPHTQPSSSRAPLKTEWKSSARGRETPAVISIANQAVVTRFAGRKIWQTFQRMCTNSPHPSSSLFLTLTQT